MTQLYVKFASRIRGMIEDQRGAATVEYAIVMVAAAGLAGILILILKSDTVRTLLENIITNALSTGSSSD
ncbi:MAG: DUF4244 domain-containing protein [Candidatus Ancillula sp.]|jgi:Flp pilus assembly pilin Flp|nr:DUF4244 domain-containing protein [Candidatus Ancillula sp.]